MDNLKGTVEELRGAFETFQIQMGSAFLPVLRKAAEGFKGMVEWFSDLNPTTKEAIGIFATVTAGVLALGAAIAGIVAIANPFTMAIVGASTIIGGLSAMTYKVSKDMQTTRENAIRFGEGVSQGTIRAAQGYMDLRDKALVNLAQLRIATGAEAQRIVNETVSIFGQMGDKIIAALNQDKINVQKAAAALLDQVPESIKPAVEHVTNTAIKAIDAQIKRAQEANKIIREGLVKYGGDLSKMPAQFAKAYQQALKDLDQTSQTFVTKVSDLHAYMENITADQGKITAAGARQWVKQIQTAYSQAEQAAKKWAAEQRKVWEEQFANGHITKQQYDMILDIVDQGEQERIQIAKDARAKALQELEKSLSDEAHLYDLKTGEMLTGYEGYVTAKTGLMESEQDLIRRGKELNHEYFQSLINDAKQSAQEVKKRQQELIRLYGDMGTASVDQLTDMIKKGGDRARLAAGALAVKTREGFKIDLGPAGQVSIQSFIKGLQTGKYTARDVAIAHMSQLRAIYGAGNFTPEGIKAIESFTNGLRSKKPVEIAEKLGLDLKSKMKIDLGPYGQVTAETFAKGLADGTYTFDAVYAYFRNQLKNGMKVDLSPEGKRNIETLKLGMQSKAIDLQEAAAILGLNIKSKVKVNLGPEGQFTVQSLLEGLASGKISIDEFAKGVKALLKNGAKTDLKPEGKAAGTSMAKGLNESKPNVSKAAEELKGTTTKTLGSANDGGGGKKAGTQFQKGIASKKRDAEKAAKSVSGGAKSNLKISGVHGLGASVASGFAAGILSGKYGVIEAAKRIARAALSAIREAIDSRSPSREMIKTGRDFGAGFVIGIRDMVPQVQKASLVLAQSAVKPVEDNLSKMRSMFQNAMRQVEPHLKGLSKEQREYFRAIVEDTDWMNDNLQYFPKHIRETLKKYFKAIEEDGDWLNDWLTHLPKNVREAARAVGKVVAPWLEGGGDVPWERVTRPGAFRQNSINVQQIAEVLSQKLPKTSSQTPQMSASANRPIINRIYNITVNGATDPLSTQREVIRAVQNLERLA